MKRRISFRTSRLPGWKIKVKDGFFLIGGGAIEKVVGDTDTWQATIAYAQEKYGDVRLCGDEQHILIGLAHCPSAVPEQLSKTAIDRTAAVFQVAGLGLPWVWFSGIDAIAIGLAILLVLPLLLSLLLSGFLNRKARRDGPRLRQQFPAIHCKRQTSREHLTKGGWIV